MIITSCEHTYRNVNRYIGDTTWVCIYCNDVSVGQPDSKYTIESLTNTIKEEHSNEA